MEVGTTMTNSCSKAIQAGPEVSDIVRARGKDAVRLRACVPDVISGINEKKKISFVPGKFKKKYYKK